MHAHTDDLLQSFSLWKDLPKLYTCCSLELLLDERSCQSAGKTTEACKLSQLNNIIQGDRHAQAWAPSLRVSIHQILN